MVSNDRGFKRQIIRFRHDEKRATDLLNIKAIDLVIYFTMHLRIYYIQLYHPSGHILNCQK